jgi:ribosomal protein S18 acetylase RimI-like enzyme
MREGDSATLRPATREDAADLARLGDMAGHGLPSFLWRRTAAPGQDPFEIGVARAARDEADFSWRNAAVIEDGGRVAAALVTYPIGDTPEPLEGLGPIVATLQALENRALGSQYVNVLAVYPEFRRRGHARRLLEEAERRAGGRPLSLIVEDGNVAARRLYDAFGFRVAAEVPMVKEDWQSDGTAWVLMLRPAAQVFPKRPGRTTLAGGGF